MPTGPISKLVTIVQRRLRADRLKTPNSAVLNALFRGVYFASLKTEEGKALQIRICIIDPEDPDPHKPIRVRPDRWKIFPLAHRIPFTVSNLIKLSKAADPWSSSLAVFFGSADQIFIWGMVDQTVHFNRMLVREGDGGGYQPPGLFQLVAMGTADLTVYRGHSFVARLEQDVLLKQQTDVFTKGPVSKFLDRGIETYVNDVKQALHPSERSELRYGGKEFLIDEWRSTLCRLLISIQRYRHGGALLLTTSTVELDIKYELDYRQLSGALRGLGASRVKQGRALSTIFEDYLDESSDSLPSGLYLHQQVAEGDSEDFDRAITGAVRFVASLSCVDGCICCSPDLNIRGFGAEIRTIKEVNSLYLSNEPYGRNASLVRIDPNHYGTRHRSMMRYCFAHDKSLGFVISQDGEIRVMTKVRDRLIMWENLQVLFYLDDKFKRRR
jgi:hypothetical protein